MGSALTSIKYNVNISKNIAPNINTDTQPNDNNNKSLTNPKQMEDKKALKRDPNLTIFCWNSQSLSSREKCEYALSFNTDLQLIQEVWNPRSGLLQVFEHHKIQVTSNCRGGGTLINITNQCLRISRGIRINMDMSCYKVLVGNNSYFWVIPIYLPKKAKRLVQFVFNWILENLRPCDIQRLILAGDWNVDPSDPSDSCSDLLKALCKQSGMTLVIPFSFTRLRRALDICILGNALKCVNIFCKPSISDHKAVLINLSTPLPGKKPFLLVLNKKLTASITLKSLFNTTDSEGFLRELEKNFRPKEALLKIEKKDHRSDLLTTLLNLNDLKDIKKEISDYWIS